MTKRAPFFALALAATALAGCENTPYLHDISPPEVEVVQDEDGNDLIIDVNLPDKPPADPSDDEDPSDDSDPGSPELFDCEDTVLWDPHYFMEDSAEVVGFPWITVSSPLSQEIRPGDPVHLVYTVTAACGPIHWGGGHINLDPTSYSEPWNEPFYGSNQAPMPMENIGTGEVQTIRSYQVVHAPDGQMFWPAREADWHDDSFIGEDLDAWQSVTYRFTFTATDVIPPGATFDINLVDTMWEDSTTGVSFNVDQTVTMHWWHIDPLYLDPVRTSVGVVE